MSVQTGGTAADVGRRADQPGLDLEVESRRAKAVKWWALVGGLVVAAQLYILGGWILSGDATPSPKGPTTVPTSHVVLARFWEAFSVVCVILVVRSFLVKPWRRERRLTLDGMLLLVWLQMYFLQDPLLNYYSNWFQYSSEFVNLGSWVSWVPGWSSLNGSNLPEPLIFIGGAYIWMCFWGTVVLCNVMHWVKRRRPNIGTFGLLSAAFGVAFAADLVLEMIWLRMGMYSYGGAIRWLSIGAGHYYQFPVYEGLFFGACWTSMAALRFFRNDKGETVAERGLDEVRTGTRGRQGLRFLALLGFANLLVFATYNIPIQWFGTHADDFPNDLLEKSYLTSGMCGLGSEYACPGRRVPLQKPDAAYVTPDGRIVAPKGLPVQVSPGPGVSSPAGVFVPRDARPVP